MNRTTPFPLPFRPLRQISGGGDGPYLVGSMFTAGYASKAERLAASCEKFGLPYVMHEVPAVHRSIHARGTDDLSFTKANLIHHLLESYRKPVLYIDADCELELRPELMGELVRSGCDFAIYNWLADERTDTFGPIAVKMGADAEPVRDRFFRFRMSIDWFSTRQLICSGLVQFYGNSAAAQSLLSEWHHNVAAFPQSGDDVCLSFTYNNLGARAEALKTRWLPKAYARYIWWIYEKPVINHKDYPQPASHFVPIEDPAGRKWVYDALVERRKIERLFPKDCVIDTQDRMVCKLVDGRVIPVKPTELRFWV